MANEQEISDGLKPDAESDLDRLESMIAADEAAEAGRAESAELQRDTRGRFAASANDGQRAGQRNTPLEISARSDAPSGQKPATATPAAASTNGAPDPTQNSSAENAQTQQQQNQPPSANGQNGETNGKSRFASELQRRDNSWKELNRQKEEWKAEQEKARADHDLREQALAAREAAMASQRQSAIVANARGAAGRFSAQDYLRNANTWEQQALQAEQAGDFEQSEQKRALAKLAREEAEVLGRQQTVPGVTPVGGTVTQAQAWSQLKADMPELLQAGSAVNRELVAMMKSNPAVMATEIGPYRAMVLAGRKLLGGMEGELAKARGEAAKVPELSKQVEGLTARIRELEGLLSLPGDQGAANRGSGGEGRSFSDLSTDDMGQRLDAELAGQIL